MSERQIAVVTGAAGFIGRYAARHLRKAGWTVIGVDQVAPENAATESLDRYVRMRLPEPGFAELVRVVRPDACVHCAGRAAPSLSMTAPAGDFHENVVLVFELLEALRVEAPACRFLLLSSAAVYGSPRELPIAEDHPTAPISPYGFHKRQAELAALEYASVFGVPTASLRIFSAFGPGLRRQVVWDIARKALDSDRVSLRGTGRESRDFIYASDIARAIAVVLDEAPMQGEAFNVASSEEVTIAVLAEQVVDALGLVRELSFDGVVPRGTPLNWRADIGALQSLGFAPKVSLATGLRRFATWCRAEVGNEDQS